MIVAAITTFPPSSLPLSSFGAQAVKRFIESDQIQQVIVLANEQELAEYLDYPLTVERCWRFNSICSVPKITLKLWKYKPDIVWLNLQYTTFGNYPVPLVLGLMLPLILKLLRYPVVITLHNFLAAVNLKEMNLLPPWWLQLPMYFADLLIMRSIASADHVILMEKTYLQNFQSKFPKTKVSLAEQDLYQVPDFQPINSCQKILLTMGYFGTYKRLENLLDAFERVVTEIPEAQLLILGRSHTHTPNYLEELWHKYENRLLNVKYLGYISDEKIHSYFWNSSLVVVTNSTVTGSSGVLRYAARYGRGLIAPKVDLYDAAQADGWGIRFYKSEDITSLAETINSTLRDVQTCSQLGWQNYCRVRQTADEFLTTHLKVFEQNSAMISKG